MENDEIIQNGLLNGKSVVGLTLLEPPVDEELLYQNQTSVINNVSSASGYDLPSAAGPVINRGNNVAWEYHNVVLTRVPGYGFGIAVSGGSDNPHFANGDQAIAISDVLKGGPAQNKLQVNDRILSANNIKLENVDYATAVGVLRDSGPSVQLVIKRRCILDPTVTDSNQTQRTTLIKQSSKKKDLTSVDFGIVFGTKLYVKEIIKKDLYENIQPGDYVLKINHLNTVDLSLKDIKKIFNDSKIDTFNVTTKKSSDENYRRLPEEDPNSHNHPRTSSYPAQNLYVQPPTRNNLPPLPPLINGGDVEFPADNVTNEEPAIPPPPRPPLPISHGYDVGNGQMTDYVSCRRELKYDSSDDLNYNYHRKKLLEQIQVDPPRYINFIKKDNSLGIRLTGGNRVGIFVAAVQPESPAQDQGLKPADLIMKVNEVDYIKTKPTREEAVLHLLSLSPNSPITLIVQTNQELFKKSQKTNQDEFYIRVNFDQDAIKQTELNLRKGDIIKITDTLVTGSVGDWEGYKLSKVTQDVTEKGILPNYQRAQEIYNEYLKKPMKDKFFRRKKKIYDNTIIFSEAYTKVIYTKVDYTRPVVLYGNLPELVREKLLQDFPDLFEVPGDSDDSRNSIKLSKIREIINKRKIAIIDLPPSALEKLQQSFNIFPVVLFFKADNKQIIKDIRNNHKSQSNTKLIRTKSTRKLLDESVKLERSIGHLISAVVNLSESSWYRRLKDTIDREQNKFIYVPSQKLEENRPSSSSSEYIFQKAIDSNRHSYASSPDEDKNVSSDFESETLRTRPDGANNDENRENTQLPNYNAPPPYSIHIHDPLQTTTPIYPSGSSSKSYKTPQPVKPKSMPTVLAHTPPESPMPKPPRVDRTKKPRSNNQTPIYFHGEQNDVYNQNHSNNNYPSSYNTPNSDVYDRSASTLRKSNQDNYVDRDRSIINSASYHSSNGTLADHRTANSNGNYSDMLLNGNGPTFPDRSLNSSGNFQDRSLNANGATYPDRSINANSTYPDRSINSYNERSHNGNYQDRSQNINYAERSQTSNYQERSLQQNGNYAENHHNGSKITNFTERAQPNPEQNYDMPKPSANSTPVKQPRTGPVEVLPGDQQDPRRNDNYLSSMSYDVSEGLSKRDVLQPDDGAYKSPYRLLPKTYKPIPPPKPLKMAKPVPEGKGKQGQGYYLNVPQRPEFNSRDSAFELYRKPENINNNSGVVGDGESKIVELEKGIFTSAGGILKPPRDSKYFGMEVVIPPLAIPMHTKQEIFFKVSDDKRNINGDSMLSPMMELGPEGLVFSRPIELRIPSYLIQKENEAKVYVSNQDNKAKSWQKIDISNYDLCKEDSRNANGMVSISIHHL